MLLTKLHRMNFTQINAGHIKYGVWLMIFTIIFSSCKSYRDYTFLQNRVYSEDIEATNQYAFDHIIKVEDNLYVNIVSSNIELNKIYNPSLAGGTESASNIRFDSETGQYINGFRVDEEGNIDLPVIGKVQVIGLNLEQCEDKIKNKTNEFLKEVNVRVRLLNYKITVLGEVNSPDVYYNFGGYNFTILDALAKAGGVTNYADIKKVVVLRPTERGQKSFDLDLSNTTVITSMGYFLYPNDVVIVNPSKRKNIQLRNPYYNVVLPTLTVAILLVSLLTR